MQVSESLYKSLPPFIIKEMLIKPILYLLNQSCCGRADCLSCKIKAKAPYTGINSYMSTSGSSPMWIKRMSHRWQGDVVEFRKGCTIMSASIVGDREQHVVSLHVQGNDRDACEPLGWNKLEALLSPFSSVPIRLEYSILYTFQTLISNMTLQESKCVC